MNRFEELANELAEEKMHTSTFNEIEYILRALAAAEEAMPRYVTTLQNELRGDMEAVMSRRDHGDWVKRDDALKAVAMASMRERK